MSGTEQEAETRELNPPEFIGQMKAGHQFPKGHLNGAFSTFGPIPTLVFSRKNVAVFLRLLRP